MKNIEIPFNFNAFDSDLEEYRISIPKGFKAEINKDNVVLKKIENEDERIRKRILFSLQKDIMATKNSGCSTKDLEKCIAWLEKQEVQKSSIFDVPKISIKDAIEVTSRMKCIPNDMKSIADFIIDYAHWDLQKSEWNQPTITVPLFRVLDALIQNGKPYCEGKLALEAIKEEKVDNANKIEPKFKVGYWITNGHCTHQITFIDSRYWCSESRVLGDTISIDKTFHLWTIEDAKDGDILAEDSCIFIIKKLGNNSTAAKTYFTLFNDGDFDDGSILYFDIDSTKPATKEQRELLFKKMPEEGYKWNPKEKKLEKIKSLPSFDEAQGTPIIHFDNKENGYK